MFVGDQGLLGQEEFSDARVSLVEAVLVEALLFAVVGWDVMVFAPPLIEAKAWMTDPADPGMHEVSVGETGCQGLVLAHRCDPIRSTAGPSSFLSTTTPPYRRDGRCGWLFVGL
jgi:hypothetical protein